MSRRCQHVLAEELLRLETSAVPATHRHFHNHIGNCMCMILVAEERKMIRFGYDQEAAVGRDGEPIALLPLVPLRAVHGGLRIRVKTSCVGGDRARPAAAAA